jgi:diaminopimelate epimerase
MRFVKGHGTENDFVLIPPDEDIHLTEDVVRALCDRRRGIGADGVLAVVRVDDSDDVRWFMDYRNADGSIAEMCGNGVRVFARYLVSEGFEQPGHLRVSTRDGVKNVDVPADGDITVDMGVAERRDDAKVTIGGVAHDARGWSMGNPHLVVLDAGDVETVDLTSAPLVEHATAFTDGVNVEVVEEKGPGHIRMRVFERGVGETRSCGTGACAAAVAAMDVCGVRTTYIVDVPGGRLMVDWRPDGRVFLTGPAVLVARGETDVSPV